MWNAKNVVNAPKRAEVTIGQPRSASGGNSPIKKIAHDAPARRRREGDDDNAKGVEPLHGCNRRALNRQDKGSRDIDGCSRRAWRVGL